MDRVWLCGFALCMLLWNTGSNAASGSSATCYFDGTQYYVKMGIADSNGIAWGTHYEELEQTGWSRLYIHSNSNYEDTKQAFCAGFVEGSLTASRISQWWKNYYINFLNNQSMSTELTAYMKAQMAWSRDNAAQYGSTDSYWRHVGYILDQFDGLCKGYSDQAQQQGLPTISTFDLYILNSAGDMLTLADVYPVNHTTTHTDKSHKLKFQHEREMEDDTDERIFHLECSGLVKNTGQDLFVGHNTWTAYYSMYRIFKTYHMPLQDSSLVADTVMFSSRPAYLQSKDDFYMMSSGLVSLETTNDIMNRTLYDLYITPQSLLTWQRVIIANRLARDAPHWTALFSRFNSGTYNNQWMVVDYNLYTPGQPIRPNTLWILEQIPGFTRSADKSQFLQTHSYWPSYNVPYFSFIYNISGYKNGSMRDGEGYEYITAPRALIFARDHSKVVDLASMKYLMQYNDYQHDPLSLGDPGNAICSRYDLRTKNPPAFGAIDGKIASYENIRNMACDAISGPTHQQEPVFEWAPQFDHIYHEGLPNAWNFDWQHIRSTDNN